MTNINTLYNIIYMSLDSLITSIDLVAKCHPEQQPSQNMHVSIRQDCHRSAHVYIPSIFLN